MFSQGSKVAVLESKLDMYEDLSREMLSKLENAVDKISEGNNRIAQILTKHDERIEQSMKTDDLIIKKNCSKEMIKLHNKTKGSVIATKRVERKTVSRWGILSIKNKKKSYFEIKDVVEKPSIKKAPSNFAIIGRYILSSKIFNEIKKLKPGQGGELHITDAIKNLINKKSN